MKGFRKNSMKHWYTQFVELGPILFLNKLRHVFFEST